MSTRYEWMHLPGIEYFAPNTDVTTGEEADEETQFEHLVENGALVLSADEVTVVTGKPEDLATWATRALSNVVHDAGLHLYEKCAICHLFVEPNLAYTEGAANIARYVHLCNDDYPTDRELDASHEPHPSGVRLPLAVWKRYGPAHMRAMFGRE